ncbi:acyltransferase [Actinoplanes capillaceus]|uniref:Acyltransferase n=2 Tax=Actinoplanes campanulatus TaxID=113559 RepID=A0ABQ3WCW7_9ACTN|nr:acyltransferase [Actinoplanes capillaceus]
MGWLDVLRGYAAVVVALFHLSPAVIGLDMHRAIMSYLDLGRYGVFVFFLVSGYVIPMSMERHGSLRKFWVGRLFRIYPAYLLTIVVILALVAVDILKVNQGLRDETVTGVLGHVTMLHEFVGLRGLIWPFWTLAFEMLFYLVVAGLFGWGLHRLSAWWAGGLALIALVGGKLLPDALFGAGFTDRRILALMLVVLFVASLAGYVIGRRPLVLAAGVIGIGFLALPLFNGHATKWSTAATSWQAVLMLSMLFAGTVIYRMHHRQINRWAGASALLIVLVAAMLTNWLHTGRERDLVTWTIASLLVAVTFAIGFTLRHRAMPKALTWLGEVSYSLYLLHMVVLYVIQYFLPAEVKASTAGRIGIGLLFWLVTLLAAWLCHRLVEQPGQALGRRVQERLRKAFGPDTPPAAEPPATPGDAPTVVLHLAAGPATPGDAPTVVLPRVR